MKSSEQERHRSGPLKQDNKRHKFGRHRTNRSINTSQKGRQEVDAKSGSKRGKDLIRRHERRNQMKQIRQNRRHETLAAKRGIGSSEDGFSLPPILVAVLHLNTTDDDNHMKTIDSIIELIRHCDDNSVSNYGKNDRNFHISFPKFKTRFEVIRIDGQDLYSALDAVKVADILLVSHSLNTTAADNTHPLLDAIYSHFLPTTVHVIHGLNYLNLKKRNESKKQIQKWIDNRFSSDEKLRSVDTNSDATQLIHYLSNCKRKANAYRSHRWQVMAENIQFVANSDPQSGSDLGTLKVYGYVRSRPLDPNTLLHIPGFGDYQMAAVDVLTDPNPLPTRTDANKLNDNLMATNDDIKSDVKFVLRPDPTKQQAIDCENTPDPMEGEQTWPTDEELAAAEQSSHKTVKKVPKGTSDYQAVWILDNSDAEEDDGDKDGSDEDDSESGDDLMDAKEDSDSEEESEAEDEKDMDTMSVTTNTNEVNYDEKLDLTEEQTAYEKFRDRRQYEMFPDEVDTPIDQSARTRFARYRGLKSFRTTPWDPMENLPPDYSRIFQFQNFQRTKRRVFNAVDDIEDDSTAAQTGWYVCVHVMNCPRLVYETCGDNQRPLLLYGLLEHEHRMSTMNLVIKQIPTFTEAIKSKETLVFHVGCRRFRAAAIFSAHTNGDKHKLERYLRPDVPVVATLYAPITFPPSSVLVYKQYADGSERLVATGSLLSCNPSRIAIKRTVLSGHPFKINRKHAVVRYMFFNREDIMWFKPIELRTKYGRKGHIREPLGTHGHMKCVFDRQMNSQDTILMNLYKRVFPKWTYEPLVNSRPVVSINVVAIDADNSGEEMN